MLHPVFPLVVWLFADKAVELMRVSTRSSDEPSTMFSGEHLPLSTYLTFIVFTSLLLIYCYLCCDALVSVPVIYRATLYCLGHILLPVVWYIVGLARRSRLLTCCCVSSSAT